MDGESKPLHTEVLIADGEINTHPTNPGFILQGMAMNDHRALRTNEAHEWRKRVTSIF
jgi:hypothetical protein